MTILFTADTHLDHTNIIQYANRPFSSIEEMNEVIIERWNSIVKNNDDIYHLGDFCFSNDYNRWLYLLSRLNGNIYLIKGNHDHHKLLQKVYKSQIGNTKLKWVKDYYELKLAPDFKLMIVMMHYAMRIWNKSHYGSLHLHGHSHGTLTEEVGARSMDVGVDTHNFYPYSLDEIKEKLLAKPGHIIDAHRKKYE